MRTVGRDLLIGLVRKLGQSFEICRKMNRNRRSEPFPLAYRVERAAAGRHECARHPKPETGPDDRGKMSFAPKRAAEQLRFLRWSQAGPLVAHRQHDSLILAAGGDPDGR